jgi:N-acetylglucosamine-6-phosphate deacetylase
MVEVAWDEGGPITDVVDLAPPTRTPPDGEPVISPGLIDLQVNGFRGQDLNSSDVTADTVTGITHALARVGVTTWVPTVVTNTEEFIHHALDQVSAARGADLRTHQAVPFVHVEGPFISDQEGARGVHDPALVRPIDAAEVARWVERNNLVGVVTVSPHADDASDQIRRIRDLGVAVSLGHTHATTTQLRAAVDAGASLATHLGNGIPSVLPRHPNPIWTLLADDRVTAGIIADGHHLPDEVITVMLRAKTVNRAFLVSDATALAGEPPGRYSTAVGGQVDVSPDGRLSYVGTDLLAGAGRHLADGLRHLLVDIGLDWAEALRLVVDTPAGLLGPAHACTRRLRPGGRPDLILLGPDGHVDTVVVAGSPVTPG